ncbi:MAG: tetraacyldisaccharide 4'-kinase [Gemmatimonadaceae bacterium]
MSTIERAWGDAGPIASGIRALLAPFGWLYGSIGRARNYAYDVGWLDVHASKLPVLSVGNLAVGGTGKTPISAYFVQRLLAAGAHPGVVLRGYGGDEPLVHQQLNPGTLVVVDADRVRGVSRAHAEGCDVAVLDDAFQHRRIARAVDCVLVSAEQSPNVPRYLPAGPWREQYGALARASLVLVTRKSASVERAAAVAEMLSGYSSRVGVAALPVDTVRTLGVPGERPMIAMRDARILAIAGIGNPQSFAEQLRAAGWRVELRTYGDHHAYTERDVAQLSAAARSFDAVVTTLKDAVKLTPLWPRTGPPLWYVSQRVVLESGTEFVDASIEQILRLRHQNQTI